MICSCDCRLLVLAYLGGVISIDVIAIWCNISLVNDANYIVDDDDDGYLH